MAEGMERRLEERVDARAEDLQVALLKAIADSQNRMISAVGSVRAEMLDALERMERDFGREYAGLKVAVQHVISEQLHTHETVRKSESRLRLIESTFPAPLRHYEDEEETSPGRRD